MGTIHWAGGNPGTYTISTPGNWLGNVAPGTLDIGVFDAAQTGPYTLIGSLTLGELTVLGNQVNIRGTLLASGQINNELSVLGGGTLTVASGGVFGGSGIVQVGTTGSAGLLVVQGDLAASDLDVLASGTLEVGGLAHLGGEIFLQDGTLLAVATPGTAGASNVTLGNALHVAGIATVAGTGAASLVLNGLVDGGGTLVVGGGTVTLGGVNSYSGGTTIDGGTVIASNAAALGTGPVTLNGGTLSASASMSIADAFTFQGASGLQVATGQTLTIGPTPGGQSNLLSGSITLGAPAAAGTIVFDMGSTGFATPSYALQAGTLKEGSFGVIGGYAAAIAAGATLDLAGHADVIGTLAGSGVITSSVGLGNLQAAGDFAGTIQGAVSLLALGTLVLTGANIATGGVSIFNFATLQLGAGGTTGSVAGDIDDGGTLVFDRSDTIAFAGTISGAGAVVKQGSNTLSLSATNSYSGGTTINGGTVVAGNARALGSGPVTLDGGTLFAPVSMAIADAFTFQGNSGLLVATGQTLAIGPTPTLDSNLLSGTITIGSQSAAGTVRFDLGSTGFGSPTYLIQGGTVVEGTSALLGGYTAFIAAGATLDLNGHTDNVGTLTGAGVITSTTDFANFQAAGTFDGSFTGEISLLAVGNLVLTGANTPSGNLGVFNNSTLQLGAGGTSGSLAGNIANDGTLVFDRSDSVAFGGTISGAGSVVKLGSNTLALNAANTYAGGTAINGGTVVVGNSAAFGTGPVTLNGGTLLVPASATLADAFLFQGNSALLVATAQTLAIGPGSGPDSSLLSGTISIGSPSASGTVRFDLGSTGFGSPTYSIQGGTVVEGSSALLGGYTAFIAAGATLDLNGHTDNVGTLSGAGVITSTSDFANFQAAGTFDGSFTGEISLLAVGNLVLTGTNTPTGSLGVFNNSTLQLGAGGTSGSIAGNIANDGTLVFDRSDRVTFANAISGAGGVVKDGAGTLDLALTNSFAGGITLRAGVLELGAPGAAGSGAITFGTGAQTLRIDGTAMPANAIAGFSTGDTIDLAGVDFFAASGVLTFSGGVLSVMASAGGVLAAVTLAGSGHLASDFALGADGGTGIALTSALPCFAAGTRIATPTGWTKVEALKPGDRVRTGAEGQSTHSVRWIGHRRVRCRSHPRPEEVRPIRIAPGAFGPGSPARPLRLSPDHAVFIDNVLIPVRYLTNGTTIAQENADTVTYYHVELADHALLLAEGLACESYLDTGNRAAFANAGAGPVQLHPEFARHIWSARSCAPLVLDGAELEAARSWLLDRAEALGYATTLDPALRVMAGGMELHPEIDGALHRFRLPAWAGGIQLLSRSAMPAETRADSGDRRRLGVAVSRIALDGRALPLGDARLSSGWHEPERDEQGHAWRWTDGDAGLALAGGGVLEIEVTRSERYWLVSPPPRRAASSA